MKKLNAIEPTNQPELSLTDLKTRIIERERQIDVRCISAVKHSIDAVKLSYEQGKDLLLAKARVNHGQWEKWIETEYCKPTGKSYRQARKYMWLASNWPRGANLDDVKSLREAFRMLGLIPEPEPEQRQLPSINVSPIVSKLNFVAEWVSKSGWEEISKWEKIQRDELKLQLKPVVELFEKL